MKKIILGSLMMAFLVGVTPVSADGGMNYISTPPAAAPAAGVVTTSQYDNLINKIVSEVLQIFTWKNDAGEITFTDTNYSAQYDCNTIFGSYSMNRKEVNLSTPASTLMACDEDAMDADQELAKDLSAIKLLTFKDGKLVMTGKNTELSFTATLEAKTTVEKIEYAGMTVAEAEEAAEADGVSFRIGTLDGEGQPLTADYQPGRITAEVEDDVVVAYTVE